jgi:hypothetical protein
MLAGIAVMGPWRRSPVTTLDTAYCRHHRCHLPWPWR